MSRYYVCIKVDVTFCFIFSCSTVKAALATWKKLGGAVCRCVCKWISWARIFRTDCDLLSRRWASSAFVISHLSSEARSASSTDSSGSVHVSVPKWLWPMTDLTYNGCLFTWLFPAVADTNQSFRFETHLIFCFLLTLKSKLEISSNIMSFTLFIISIFLYQE